VRCATPDTSTVTEKLIEAIPALAGKTITTPDYAIDASQEEVSALIGGSFLNQSLIAIALGFVGIVLYMTFRFEFSFALGGFVAIFHDVIICIGMVVLMGGELSLIHVGAVLTIAGYSISDTIVVFDRVREMLLIRTDSVEKIMNEAINATLSRTLLTSSATLVSVAILGILGGSALRDFGVIIFIGIIARFPHSIVDQFRVSQNLIIGLIILASMLAIIAGVVLVTQGTRRIPVQYAKRVVGRKVYGGVTQYIPLRVNTAGVMPIIFAQSIMFIPQTILTFFPESDFMQTISGYFS